ncbi:MAG: hypothetical protein HUK09_09485 [Bacteroidaceae bacterium]|nr:hypothetical protein [Bacteroidaceae bacterium]
MKTTPRTLSHPRKQSLPLGGRLGGGFFLLLFFLFAFLPSFAQQAQEELRSTTLFQFTEFRPAKVVQTFGRQVTARANILLKNAALCYIDEKDGRIYQATNASIVGVNFDSLRYRRVRDQVMGEVIAERGGHQLLCVTTIDMERYHELTRGGADLPFFEIDMAGYGVDQFMDLTNAEQQTNTGYPLRRDYYFNIGGRIVAAKERLIKREVAPDMRTAFKNLMADRWWSWRDAASLTKLLMYFPQ